MMKTKTKRWLWSLIAIVIAGFALLNVLAYNHADIMGVPSFPSAELLVFWGGRQSGFNGFAHNPVRYAESLKCPALFMHGAHDPRATISEGRRVFAAVPGLKDFKEFASAGHEAYVATDPTAWRSTVAEFIAKL